MNGVEAEHKPTNLALGVRARVVSHIPIMEGLVDFLMAEGEDPSGSTGRAFGERVAPDNRPTSSVAA